MGLGPQRLDQGVWGRGRGCDRTLQDCANSFPGRPAELSLRHWVGAAHFEAARYKPAIRWFKRGLAEHPTAVWNNRFLVPAFVLAGQLEDARQSLTEFAQTYPDLTITEVRAGLPYSASFLDRVAEGLERVGMPIS